MDGIEHLTENSYGKRDNIIQDIRFSCVKHFPEGFGDTQLTRRDRMNIDIEELTNSKKQKEFRRSC